MGSSSTANGDALAAKNQNNIAALFHSSPTVKHEIAMKTSIGTTRIFKFGPGGAVISARDAPSTKPPVGPAELLALPNSSTSQASTLPATENTKATSELPTGSGVPATDEAADVLDPFESAKAELEHLKERAERLLQELRSMRSDLRYTRSRSGVLTRAKFNFGGFSFVANMEESGALVGPVEHVNAQATTGWGPNWQGPTW